MKLVLDEIFSRRNFITLISWQRVPEGRTVLGQGQTPITVATEYLLAYAKSSKGRLKRVTKRINATNKIITQYSLLVKEFGNRALVEEFKDSSGQPVRLYTHKGFKIEKLPQKLLEEQPEIFIKLYLENFEKIAQSVGIQKESTFQQRLLSKVKRDMLYSAEFISSKGKYKGEHQTDYFINGRKLLFLKDYSIRERNGLFREVDMNNFWSHEEIPVTGIAEEGRVTFKRGKKPEKLLERIIQMGSESGDWVLDSFAGSGTTGAVAHKMERKWIIIEMAKHAETHCIPRIDAIINGKDQDKHSYGGGFRYCVLGDSLFKKDESDVVE